MSMAPLSARRRSEPVKGELRKPYPVWLVTLAAFVLPGSGQMLNGNAFRGITMQFFMLFLGFVTYEVTDSSISLIGRFAGGIFVYVFSVIDANAVAKRRRTAWARIEAGGDKPDGRGTQPRQASAPRPKATGATQRSPQHQGRRSQRPNRGTGRQARARAEQQGTGENPVRGAQEATGPTRSRDHDESGRRPAP